MGWAVKRSRMENKAITQGETELQQSTVEMFEKAKEGTAATLKAAEKILLGLNKVKSKLQQSGTDCLSSLKARMQAVSAQVPFINEVPYTFIEIDCYYLNRNRPSTSM